MKSILTKRLAAIENALALKIGDRQVCLLSSELEGEALEASIARWRGGEDLPGAPNGMTDRKSATIIVLADLR